MGGHLEGLGFAQNAVADEPVQGIKRGDIHPPTEQVFQVKDKPRREPG